MLLKLSVRLTRNEFQIVRAAWQTVRLPKTVSQLFRKHLYSATVPCAATESELQRFFESHQ